MTGDVKIVALLVLLVAQSIRGDTFYSMINREDPCVSLCEKTPARRQTLTNNIYVKSCCQRGCRFFNLVDLRYGIEPNSLNGTRDACEASCTEAYTELQDRYACSTGCDFMAKQRVSDLLSLFSIAICVEEGMESNALLMSPDIPENDILTDPGLRKELLPRWWDSDGFKLPQTYVKTVPIDAGTMDYALSSDYSGEIDRVGVLSNWLHYTSNGFGVPRWIVTSVIMIFAALILIWLYFIGKAAYHTGLCTDKSFSPKVTLYIPDEAPLYKKPPPKYVPSSGNCEF